LLVDRLTDPENRCLYLSHELRIHMGHESTYVLAFVVYRLTDPENRYVYVSHELRIYMSQESIYETGIDVWLVGYSYTVHELRICMSHELFICMSHELCV